MERRAFGMLPAATRREVLERDDFTCQYCGFRPKHLQQRTGFNKPRYRATLHVDHMVPVSRGGTHDIDNLATACVACNLEKHAKTDWFVAIAYCAGCGRFERKPHGAYIHEGIGSPIFVCPACTIDMPEDWVAEPDEIDLEMAAWDAVEQSVWAA